MCRLYVLVILLVLCCVFVFCLSSYCVLCAQCPVTLDYPFLIAPSVFSNVYSNILTCKTTKIRTGRSIQLGGYNCSLCLHLYLADSILILHISFRISSPLKLQSFYFLWQKGVSLEYFISFLYLCQTAVSPQVFQFILKCIFMYSTMLV